jgi:hypothetical protein
VRQQGLEGWRGHGLALLLVLAAGAAVHGTRICANYHRHHWEDWRFFRHSRTTIRTPLDCFRRPGAWPGLYRPISTNGYYLLGREAFGNRVEAYHVVSVVLFVSNALLLHAIARKVLPQPWPLVVPAVFASRAAHYQVLLNTSEVQALLSSFFALVSILGFLATRERWGGRADLLCLGGLVLALLSKESAVAVPAILTAYAWLFRRGEGWRRLLAPWLVLGAWALMFVLVRRAFGGEPTGFAYDVSWRIAGRYLAYALSFLNLPIGPAGSSEFPPRAADLASHWAVVVAAALAAGAGLGLTIRSRRWPSNEGIALRAAVFGLWWFVLGMAPFVVFADRLFVRYTYFGHAGLALGSGGIGCVLSGRLLAALDRTSRTGPRLASVGAGHQGSP